MLIETIGPLKKKNLTLHEFKISEAESANESSDKDSVLWYTEELENIAKETLQLLMYSVKSIIPSKRSLCYLGNSFRIQRKRKAKEKNVAVEHKKKNTDFFNFTSTKKLT
ncbi:4203_t:CDS:1 [Funneliformis geosporum]|uniref:11551_t:CDS:1 n=1 Tax=Funneliformis geosporum TaxID=1117311 RepID=A0A9W4SN29_9GLOM|nr:4203_t:CDS:1 [Funneliformis geosporum]CAI2175131.1 11551_t:CDS:1 [Funneliformis geosporum]